MIGQTIEARPRPNWASRVLIALALVLVVASALGGGVHCALAAVLPAILALAFWGVALPRVALYLEEDALVLMHNNRRVPYAEIVRVWVGDESLKSAASAAGGNGPFYVLASQYRLVLPEVLDVDRLRFCQFLLDRIPVPASASPPPELAEYASAQLAKFGAEKVIVTRQRSNPGTPKRPKRLTLTGIALIVSGVVWIVICAGTDLLPVRQERDIFGGIGILSVLIGIVVAVLGNIPSPQRRRFRNVRNACLVMGPAGIAVSQGDVRGAMSWEEVVAVESNANSFIAGRAPGVTLRVAGGKVTLPDIYGLSPTDIESAIRRFRGEIGPAKGDRG